jgi:hypothetical protein
MAVSPRSPVWPWAALVTVGGVIATAHGLYAVAVASGVPWQIACLYPAMADGLALVAYAATKRLDSTKYPWLVVVVAAGLSGLAQGANLAGLGAPGAWLRFGVGAAPAVAVLASAHLLWLVGRPRVETGDREDAPTDAGGPGDHPKSPNPGPSAPALNGNGHGETNLAKALRVLGDEVRQGRRPGRRQLAAMADVHESTARDALALTKKG